MSADKAFLDCVDEHEHLDGLEVDDQTPNRSQPRVLPASGLMAFGPARDEYAQLSARYIDRILKGAKPGDLAVEQTTRFSLAINLKSAITSGLTIPPSLLLRADEVIE
jgi:hypothetical protein